MQFHFYLLQTVFSQNEDSIMIKKISDEILTNGKAYDNLRHLTKKIGGRLAGSPQMTMAEQWGEQVMRTSGADKVIMQECKVPHWVRGGEDKAEVTGGKKLRCGCAWQFNGQRQKWS